MQAAELRSMKIGPLIRSRLGKADVATTNVLILGLIGLGTFFATRSPVFFTVGNAKIILVNSSILAVVVVAMGLLMISGGVDLSIGSNVGLSGTLLSIAVTQWHWNPVAAIAISVLASAGVGSVNGLLCATWGFNPVIVTLGMLGIIRGVTLLTQQDPIFDLGSTFTTIGAGQVAGVPILVIFAFATFVVGGVFLVLTPWGRYIYAIGINRQAAFLSALPVRALPFFLYMATGAAAGLAGVLLASRLNGTSPGDQGMGLELSALTAILLGGVAWAGGRGKLLGVVAALLFLGVLQNGLVLMNVTPYVQLIVLGLALVVAAGLDVAGGVLAVRFQVRTKVAGQLRDAAAAAAGEGAGVASAAVAKAEGTTGEDS
jgi:ribose/xylose/arabinose/galactoside ABC-type transport system permease subunit